ncbi:hypothetical protein L21TH_2652 [Caldisalinibacter kiritimatiensis]|uniref:Uncharacterized protein n=1 Tax=Caldisalinibacter kiritimatiensis TaxID=1304284 RepID=R1CRG9_9FIRM|nr:hypothetical protein L21TH_2652 [Caldisalinibacter kiritimatiensis]
MLTLLSLISNNISLLFRLVSISFSSLFNLIISSVLISFSFKSLPLILLIKLFTINNNSLMPSVSNWSLFSSSMLATQSSNCLSNFSNIVIISLTLSLSVTSISFSNSIVSFISDLFILSLPSFFSLFFSFVFSCISLVFGLLLIFLASLLVVLLVSLLNICEKSDDSFLSFLL